MDILKRIANNDNEICGICNENDEYIIQIQLWNGKVCKLRTVGCKRIFHNTELINEFGDILVDSGLYRFMTVDGEDVILEISADLLIEAD